MQRIKRCTVCKTHQELIMRDIKYSYQLVSFRSIKSSAKPANIKCKHANPTEYFITNYNLHPRLSRDQNDYNFDFRMQYKTLSRDQAVVRYGGIKHEGKRASVSLLTNFFADSLHFRQFSFHGLTSRPTTRNLTIT